MKELKNFLNKSHGDFWDTVKGIVCGVIFFTPIVILFAMAYQCP